MKLPSFRAARAKITTSADVAAEVEQHRRMLAEATDALSALDASRQEILVGDDVATIREHEAKSAELRLALARLQARLDALAGKAEEIRASEAAAALDALRADVEGRAAEAAAWLRDDYAAAAREIVAGLTALASLELEIKSLNAKLTAAGRDGESHVAGVQSRLGIFGGSGMERGMPVCAGTALSLTGATRLVELVGGVKAPGWNPVQWS